MTSPKYFSLFFCLVHISAMSQKTNLLIIASAKSFPGIFPSCNKFIWISEWKCSGNVFLSKATIQGYAFVDSLIQSVINAHDFISCSAMWTRYSVFGRGLLVFHCSFFIYSYRLFFKQERENNEMHFPKVEWPLLLFYSMFGYFFQGSLWLKSWNSLWTSVFEWL